jgi:hypothetical protein
MTEFTLHPPVSWFDFLYDDMRLLQSSELLVKNYHLPLRDSISRDIITQC